MFESVLIGATGLRNQQIRLDTIADNVANVNTAGFRANRLDFKDALYTAGIVPAKPRTPEGDQQKGHGVIIASVTKDPFQGNLQETLNKMDFAIEGRGFFEVEDSSGEILYTRGGDFSFYSTPEGEALVNASGYFVHDINGERIIAPKDTNTISVSDAGTVLFSGGVAELEVSFGVYTFTNETGLAAVGKGNFEETEATGERRASQNVLIRQGYLEGSNVNLGTEFTRLIRSQRAFQLASRAVKTADDMEGIANNMRR